MNYWGLPIAIVALVLNVVALLLTFLGAKSVFIVLSLAIPVDLVVVIAFASRPRTLLAKTAGADLTAITPQTVLDVEPPADNTPIGKDSEVTSSVITSPDPDLLKTIEELLNTSSKSGPGIEDGSAAVGQDQYGISEKEELLDNSQWLKLVEECIELEGDLVNLYEHLDVTSQHIVDHTTLRIQEMLERSHVEIIANEHAFNRARHQTKPMHPIPRPGTPITVTLHPGFAVGRRVLRRAEVQVASAAWSDK